MRTCRLTLATLTLLSACAKGGGDSPGGALSADREAQRAVIAQQSLVTNVEELARAPFRAACDAGIDETRLAVARELEERKAEIDAWHDTQPSSSRFRRVPFGPTTAREQISVPAAREGWITDVISWKALAADLRAQRGKPAGAELARIDNEARSLIGHEVERAVKGYNKQYDETSGPALERLREELGACLDAHCEALALSPESRSFVDRTYRYRLHEDKIKAATGPDARTAALEDFEADVKEDASLLAFRPAASARRASDGRYVLAIDAGPFAAAGDQLKRYFEGTWRSTDGKTVTLELVSRPDVFHIRLGDVDFGRSYVSPRRKEVVLQPYLRTTTVGHELGHVLGFPDNYFYVFDPSDCTWRDRRREDDVMSEHETGRVLEQHWGKLAEHYR